MSDHYCPGGYIHESVGDLEARAEAAEADAEVRKRLYEASVKDRARLREALMRVVTDAVTSQGCRDIARAALGEEDTP